MHKSIEKWIAESIHCQEACLRSCIEQIARAAHLLISVLRSGGKIVACGNGGSAADAQHFAAELVGRFRRERKPLPAIALNANTSALTSIANDYGYDEEYAPRGGASRKDKSSGRAESFPSASPSTESSADYGGYSRPPERQRLGTEYGETTYSSVRETTFRRKNKRRPDRLYTINYDSLDGLRARGVIHDHHHHDHYYDHDHYHREPEPFPDRRFSHPPPRR